MAYSTYMPGAFPAQPAPGYYAPAPYPQQAYPAPQNMPQAYPPAAPQQPQQTVNARMVTSREEASAAQIPFDSTINIFINLPADEIYIKRFDMATGGAIFAEYRRGQPQPRASAPDSGTSPQYATQDMLEQLRGDVGEIRAELEELKTGAGKRARRASDE